MDDVITLSSDSDEDDCDVEIVGSYNVKTPDDPMLLSAVKIDDSGMNVKVPTKYIDLAYSKWTPPASGIDKRLKSTSLNVADLTKGNKENGTKQETEEFPAEYCQIKKDNSDTSNEQKFSFQTSSSGEPPVSVQRWNCAKLKQKQDCKDSKAHLKQTDVTHGCSPTVRLRRISCLESHVTELNASMFSVNINIDRTEMSAHPRIQGSNSEEPEHVRNLRTTVTSNGLHMETLHEESPPKLTESLIKVEKQEKGHKFRSTELNAEISQHPEGPSDSPCSNKGSSIKMSTEQNIKNEDKSDSFCLSTPISSPSSPSSSQDEAQDSFFLLQDTSKGSFKRDIMRFLEQLEGDHPVSEHNYLSDSSSPLSFTSELKPLEPPEPNSPPHTSPTSCNTISYVQHTPPSEHTQAEVSSERLLAEVKTEEASNCPDLLFHDITGQSPLPVLKTEDMDEGPGAGSCSGDLENDDPVYLFWQDWSHEENVNEESRFDTDFWAASREDRDFVCPVALSKLMSGETQALIYKEDEAVGAPEVLCRQSLRLVYSTIDENYTEGTLQLLADLLHPGYSLPCDILSHLLNDILLNPQCPYHLCVQAFTLLIRTQRHHLADKTTVPWNWDLLTSVMDSQRHRCQVVRMLLDYVVQTLEDDFQAKRSASALHHSIVKAMLSCDRQFSHVRDVLKWLFSAIKKSTEQGETTEAAKERDEQLRMVSIFQRMLSLALEVDCFPALHSAKLSQELFDMLISSTTLQHRAQRMLLLESLQSKQLRCKLLEYFLGYACPVKISLPMSLSLLLHYMKYCTLAPDPTDGTERWQRWEELVHLLWMLLLSYNQAMRGYLCGSGSKQRHRFGTSKWDDLVSKPAVCEAVEALLSRSKADLGQALPLHVAESLVYLQDHLLDICQC